MNATNRTGLAGSLVEELDEDKETIKKLQEELKNVKKQVAQLGARLSSLERTMSTSDSLNNKNVTQTDSSTKCATVRKVFIVIGKILAVMLISLVAVATIAFLIALTLALVVHSAVVVVPAALIALVVVPTLAHLHLTAKAG